MGFLGGAVGYRALRWYSKDGETGYGDGSAYADRSKLKVLLGPRIWDELQGKAVVDFGCGSGSEAVEVAKRGARKVVGLDNGCVIAAFGPTWYHPLGGHLFSVFPWAHLIFTEPVLIRWRADFKTDGATKFDETEGGLNQMSIRRFEKLVERSAFRLQGFEAVPIRTLRPLASQLTREFTTAIVRCKLAPR